MGLFDRNNYDRGYGARDNMGGNRSGGGMRGMWNRAENTARDAFDAGGYDREYGASRGGSSWAGDSYGGSSIRGGSFDRDDAYRAGGGAYNQGGSYNRYDSTYRQGGSFGGGYGASGHTGEGLGDRMRQGWHRLAEGARDALDRNDNDRHDYGYRGSPNANVNGGLSRDNLSRGEQGYGATGYGRTGGGYDGDFGNRSWSGARGGMTGGAGYNRDLNDRDWMDRDRGGDRGYGAGYKSREQTDNGDPFGDRTAHTPIRMVRGGFRGGSMGAGNMGSGNMGAGSMGSGYDRQYKEGLGDEPYYNAQDFGRGGMGAGGMQGGGMSGYDRNFRNNRSDRNDWF